MDFKSSLILVFLGGMLTTGCERKTFDAAHFSSTGFMLRGGGDADFGSGIPAKPRNG